MMNLYEVALHLLEALRMYSIVMEEDWIIWRYDEL